MNNQPHPSQDDVSPSQLKRVDEICNRFEAAWQAGQRPRIEDCLATVLESERAFLLEHLLALEVAYRRDQGESPLPEEYRQRFPEYAGVVQTVLVGAGVPGAGHPSPSPVSASAHELGTGPESLSLAAQKSAPLNADFPTIPGYEIQRVLGRGGMGVVYLARQIGLKRMVALKMVLVGAHAGPDVLARFRAEAEAVARLKHQNFVQIYEINSHQGLPYFSLEYVEGESLHQRLAQGPLPAPEAARLIEILARAMHYAHRQGIIHRDLKPANILLTTDSVPKIADFGLAKQLNDPESLTRSGAILGTPSYMAPEQAEGKKNAIGPASDVYALGSILYHMLTGRPPFKADSPLETLKRVVTEEPEPLTWLNKEVPPGLEAICLKCPKKDPASRYASARALADDLQRFLSGEIPEAQLSDFVEEPRDPLAQLSIRPKRLRRAVLLSDNPRRRPLMLASRWAARLLLLACVMVLLTWINIHFHLEKGFGKAPLVFGYNLAKFWLPIFFVLLVLPFLFIKAFSWVYSGESKLKRAIRIFIDVLLLILVLGGGFFFVSLLWYAR
jgi:serine/threonine-protein kinase